MKILIVEDEQDLRETIRTSLLKEKFVVETAADYFRHWIKSMTTITTAFAGYHVAWRERSGLAA